MRKIFVDVPLPEERIFKQLRPTDRSLSPMENEQIPEPALLIFVEAEMILREHISRLEVSEKTRRECEAELAEAKRSGWHIRTSS